LIVSTLDIPDQNFLQDRFSFRNEGTIGHIWNEGTLSASKGVVALIAPEVKNEGLISASIGKVLLLSADAVTLSFSDDGLMSFLIEEDAKEGLIEHFGSIRASNGEVFIKLGTAKEAVGAPWYFDLGLITDLTVYRPKGSLGVVTNTENSKTI